MTETKTPEYWEELSKKGNIQSKISFEIEESIKEYTKRSPSEIFISHNSRSIFSDEFTNELQETIDSIISKYSSFTPKQIKDIHKKYFDQIYTFLHLVHIKKVACEVIFDSYFLLGLFRALDGIISEAQFIITPEGIFIDIMDPSRICLIRIILNNSSYKYYTKGKYALNIEDLKNISKCEKNDKSQTTFEFREKNLSITINSEKFGSKIPRTLNYLDLELEEIPLKDLKNINYTFQFELKQHTFIHTMKNLGVYSDVIEITANNKIDKRAIAFKEEDQKKGTSEFIWGRKHLLNFQYNKSLVEAELKEEEDERIKNILQTNLSQEISSSSHSLSFLDWIKEIAKILDKDDSIHFSLKEDTPIKIQTKFTKLGDSSLLYFLSPRGLEKDGFDDDDEELDDF